jgi:hypothetical protein
VGVPGRVVQVNPMKSKFKPPRSKRLKLRCGVPLSNFAFKFNLRRYNQERRKKRMLIKSKQKEEVRCQAYRAFVVSQIVNLRFLFHTASYDVASIIYLAVGGGSAKRALGRDKKLTLATSWDDIKLKKQWFRLWRMVRASSPPHRVSLNSKDEGLNRDG